MACTIMFLGERLPAFTQKAVRCLCAGRTASFNLANFIRTIYIYAAFGYS